MSGFGSPLDKHIVEIHIHTVQADNEVMYTAQADNEVICMY